jgi:hypothetical protein
MGGRTGGLCVLAALVLTARPPVPLTAQVAPNRATAYLHPTDVRDARALWVNPAGLALLREASVYAELAVADPGARGRLRQLNAGFNSRGLSFGYQRDVFDGGRRGHTYRLGIAGGSEGLAAGLAVARYRGDTKGTSWDLGLAYVWTPALTVGGVIANIGQPAVRGVEQRLTFVPGATWRPLGPTAAFSAHARITPDSVVAYAFGVAWQSGGGRGGGGGGGGGAARLPVSVFARLDTDGGLRRGAFAIGFSIGGADRVGAVISAPGDVSGVDAASLYGLSSRAPGRRR